MSSDSIDISIDVLLTIPWATLLIILPLLTAMAVCVWSRIVQPLVLMFSLSMVIAVIGLTAGAITKYWLKDGAIAAQMDWVIWVLWISTVLNAIYFLPILWRLWLLPAPIQWPSKVTAANRSKNLTQIYLNTSSR